MPSHQLLFFIAGTKSLEAYVPSVAAFMALEQTKECIARLKEAHRNLPTQMFHDEADKIMAEYGDLGMMLRMAFFAGLINGIQETRGVYEEAVREASA